MFIEWDEWTTKLFLIHHNSTIKSKKVKSYIKQKEKINVHTYIYIKVNNRKVKIENKKKKKNIFALEKINEILWIDKVLYI